MKRRLAHLAWIWVVLNAVFLGGFITTLGEEFSVAEELADQVALLEEQLDACNLEIDRQAGETDACRDSLGEAGDECRKALVFCDAAQELQARSLKRLRWAKWRTGAKWLFIGAAAGYATKDIMGSP